MNTALESSWTALTAQLEKDFGKVPDLQSVLFLIGVNVLGQGHRKFTKEEKQDLMHIAICELMALAGYYELSGRDADGWPHYTLLKTLPAIHLLEQEDMLKAYSIQYFEEIEYFSTNENG